MSLYKATLSLQIDRDVQNNEMKVIHPLSIYIDSPSIEDAIMVASSKITDKKNGRIVNIEELHNSLFA